MSDTRYMLAFIEPTEHGDYHDALPFDPNEKFDNEAIQAQIKDRVDNWVAAISKQPEEVIETEDSLQEKIEQAIAEKLRLEEQIIEQNARLDEQIVTYTSQKLSLSKVDPSEIKPVIKQ